MTQNNSFRRQVRDYFAGLQDKICQRLEQVDGKASFHEDLWQHQPRGSKGSGGGRTRVIAAGGVFEKGGVNLAEVTGELTPRMAQRLHVDPRPFFATGISLVLHPRNPFVPTVHMNLRYIQLGQPEGVSDEGDAAQPEHAWFGGGADLTPYYLFSDDAAAFHRVWKAACDRHGADKYPKFKRECDEYFWNRHRDEARGVGGIFFDYLREDLPALFGFVRDIGDQFLEAYVPIVERRCGMEFNDEQRHWQLIRRGRYVEFNLIHDRGTLFGLETQGRTESILMSLPPEVRWEYDHRPAPGSPEAELVAALRAPRDWCS